MINLFSMWADSLLQPVRHRHQPLMWSVKTRCRIAGKPGKPGDKLARLARNSACGLRGKNALKF